MPFRYPISLELEGRRCVVIGGGEVAEHKARSLLQAGACVKVVAETITDGLLALARRGELTLETRAYSRGDLSGVFLAIAATDDVGTNAAVFEEAEEEKVLINVVDDPSHCHFAVPSVLRRGDFCVAISTGGKAPALSKRARKDLSRQFGPEYGVLVELLGKVREEQISRRSVDFETWAARWQQVLEHGDLVGLVRRGRLREVLETVRAILSGEEDPASPPAGRVMIVGAGPGDPGLITVRGREALAAADVVVYDRLVDPSLVEGKEAIYAGKEPGRHCLPQEKISELLIRLARQGKTVVRLKGGDPFVFGRGAEEAEALAEAGVSFEIVPGLSSAIAAAAYAGIPVTDRRCSSSVAVVTGHCAGSEVDWGGLATSVDTIVVLMGVRKLPEIAKRLIAGGRDPSTPAAVIEGGTLPGQRVITAPLAELASAAAQAGVSSPALIVIGEVVRLRERIDWFGKGPRERESARA